MTDRVSVIAQLAATLEAGCVQAGASTDHPPRLYVERAIALYREAEKKCREAFKVESREVKR